MRHFFTEAETAKILGFASASRVSQLIGEKKLSAKKIDGQNEKQISAASIRRYLQGKERLSNKKIGEALDRLKAAEKRH